MQIYIYIYIFVKRKRVKNINTIEIKDILFFKKVIFFIIIINIQTN